MLKNVDCFSRYSDIENTYRTKVIETLYKNNLDKGRWTVSAKIHGSNLAMYINSNGSINFATRNRMLESNEDHNNHIKVFEKMQPKINNIINKTKTFFKFEHNKSFIVIIYGEIFGGQYPHPDVEKIPDATRVMKGIYYCPFNDFMAFDAAILTEKSEEENKKLADELEILNKQLDTLNINSSDSEEKEKIYSLNNKINSLTGEMKRPFIREFLHYADYRYLLSDSNIKIAPILDICDFETALEYSPVFKSVVHKEYNLPELENNYEEGVVIKPVEYKEFPNKSRVIFKNKNPKFSEVNKSFTPKEDYKSVEYSDITNSILNIIHTYSNANRLKNVISKFSNINDKMFGQILKEFNNDTYNDIEKDYFNEIQILKENKEIKHITKSISDINAKFLKSVFLNIIDGEF